MPHLKESKGKSGPLWKEWDYKAQKKGVRHTVYSVNRDEYTGEWLDNKKHGEYGVMVGVDGGVSCQGGRYFRHMQFASLGRHY